MGQLEKQSTTAQSSADINGRSTTRHPASRTSRTTQPSVCSNLERSLFISSILPRCWPQPLAVSAFSHGQPIPCPLCLSRPLESNRNLHLRIKDLRLRGREVRLVEIPFSVILGKATVSARRGSRARRGSSARRRSRGFAQGSRAQAWAAGSARTLSPPKIINRLARRGRRPISVSVYGAAIVGGLEVVL